MLAIAEKGNLFGAPDTYMEKIAIGANMEKNLLDLDNSVEKNIKILADAKNKKPDELTACLLKRDRHSKIIEALNNLKVKIKFISDGDVLGAISVIDPSSPVDIYLGIGGGPEGVLAAAALSCLGGQLQTRLILNEEEKIRARKQGINDFNKKYNIDEIVRGDVMFCASAVTNGELLSGIIDEKNTFKVSTYALHKDINISKKVVNIHQK